MRNRYETYASWKKAVKRQFPEAKFHGDKDIDSAFVRGSYYAEWDGAYGTIELLEASSYADMMGCNSKGWDN